MTRNWRQLRRARLARETKRAKQAAEFHRRDAASRAMADKLRRDGPMALSAVARKHLANMVCDASEQIRSRRVREIVTEIDRQGIDQIEVHRDMRLPYDDNASPVEVAVFTVSVPALTYRFILRQDLY